MSSPGLRSVLWPGALALVASLSPAAATDPVCPPGGTVYAWDGLDVSLFGRHCSRCHDWTYDEVLVRQLDIIDKLVTGNMPPFFPLDPAEQAPLLEWFACGAPAAAAGPVFQRGDANADGAFDIGDPIVVLGFLFAGGVTLPCLDAADGDGNGRLEISDPVYCLQYLYLGTAAPPPPFLHCGSLPRLGCLGYAPCE